MLTDFLAWIGEKYEREAFGIGKTLMRASFDVSREIDSKYYLFMETDFAHFWHFLQTGQQGDVETFNSMLVRSYAGWMENKQGIEPVAFPAEAWFDESLAADVV